MESLSVGTPSPPKSVCSSSSTSTDHMHDHGPSHHSHHPSHLTGMNKVFVRKLLADSHVIIAVIYLFFD